jgi:hypothetical protein
MQKSLTCLVIFSITIMATALYTSGRALATKAEGYKKPRLLRVAFAISMSLVPFKAGRVQLATRMPRSYCNKQRDRQTFRCRTIPGLLVEIAKREGISLDHFVALAVAEKVARLELVHAERLDSDNTELQERDSL